MEPRARLERSWPLLSGSSRDPTAGETAAQSRKEQSVDVGGALLQLVHLDSDAGADGLFCS
jgi:hypothetical protein